MKNKSYRQSALKKKLLQCKRNGTEFLIWKLNPYIKRQIEELGYKVEPFLYVVQTKKFYHVKEVRSSFLKDLHYAKHNGKNYIVRQLNHTEKDWLDRYGIQYYPLKYKIYLYKNE